MGGKGGQRGKGGGHQEGEKGVGGEGCNTIYWPTLPPVSQMIPVFGRNSQFCQSLMPDCCLRPMAVKLQLE